MLAAAAFGMTDFDHLLTATEKFTLVVLETSVFRRFCGGSGAIDYLDE